MNSLWQRTGETSIPDEQNDMMANDDEIEIGLAVPSNLPELLALYRYLNPDDPVLALDDALQNHWKAILNNPALHYVVCQPAGMVGNSGTLRIEV